MASPNASASKSMAVLILIALGALGTLAWFVSHSDFPAPDPKLHADSSTPARPEREGGLGLSTLPEVPRHKRSSVHLAGANPTEGSIETPAEEAWRERVERYSDLTNFLGFDPATCDLIEYGPRDHGLVAEMMNRLAGELYHTMQLELTKGEFDALTLSAEEAKQAIAAGDLVVRCKKGCAPEAQYARCIDPWLDLLWILRSQALRIQANPHHLEWLAGQLEYRFPAEAEVGLSLVPTERAWIFSVVGADGDVLGEHSILLPGTML